MKESLPKISSYQAMPTGTVLIASDLKASRYGRKLDKRILIHIFALFLLVSLFYFPNLYKISFNSENNIFLFSNLFITLFALISLIKELYLRPYSIAMLHWTFVILFLGIAPFYQYINDQFVYHNYISSNELLYANILIISWIIFYYIGGKIINFDNKNKKSFIDKLLKKRINISGFSNEFWLVLSASIAIFLLGTSSLSDFFSRASALGIFRKETLAETQLITAFFRNIPLYSLVFSIAFYKKNNRGLIFLMSLLIINLIINSPFGMPRFNAGAVYLGILIFTFSLFKRKKIFIYIFFCTMILIFPLIDTFRYNSFSEIANLYYHNYNIQEYFLTGNYDAFSMIIYSMIYISDFGPTYGYQLLGPMLFWLPRTVWMSKPVGTGSMIAQTYGEPFTNVSASPIVEGFINFGILGVLLFGFLFGALCSYLDRIYWKCIKSGYNESTYITILYPFLMFLFFFMFRGDLLSSFAYMAGHVVIFSLVFYINYRLFNSA